MKLKELSKDELVNLTTKLLKDIGAYPGAATTIYEFLLDRWNKKRKALEEKAKRFGDSIEDISKWWKVQEEMDNPKNDIDYCTRLDEMREKQ